MWQILKSEIEYNKWVLICTYVVALFFFVIGVLEDDIYTIVPNTWKQLFKQQIRWKKGWIVNATITSRFIYKRHPWVSIFYYFPLLAISFLTPIMAFRAMIYTPVVHGTLPIIYIANVLIMASVMIVAYRMFSRENKYWPYVFLWSIFSLFVGAYLIIYALLRIQDRKWVTR